MNTATYKVSMNKPSSFLRPAKQTFKRSKKKIYNEILMRRKKFHTENWAMEQNSEIVFRFGFEVKLEMGIGDEKCRERVIGNINNFKGFC
jgi:hypothetical protein